MSSAVTHDLWKRIPADLRARHQWVLAGADKAPLYASGDGFDLAPASPTKPATWMTFERAVALAWVHKDLVTTCTTKDGQTITRTGLDLGYVLSEDDPYSCIDLDVKDATTHPGKPQVWTSADDFQRFVSIINNFASYTERSRSGKGIHLWVRGDIGPGFRRDGVEVYSRERYMICTGDVYVDEPVADRATMLLNMVAQMRPITEKSALIEHPAAVDDWCVFQMAGEAANADKFWGLWSGDWSGMGYPSQSEADMALMSMFTFYSESNKQCRDLFRASGLGQRDKAAKDDRHLDHMLRVIRARQAREQSAEVGALMQAAETVALLREAVTESQGGAAPTSAGGVLPAPREVVQLAEPGLGDTPQPPPPAASAVAQLAPVPQRLVDEGADGMPWPPGFVGTVARFIYSNSYLPIKEVSIVGALGLMAGLAGKAWHIPQSGLNLYIILVARSAIGKEAMHSGIAALVSHCSKKFAFFGNYVDFTEYVSGPALVKACMSQPSFVNVSGEWGRRLKRLAADERQDGPLQTLRTQMTNLYQKSGPQSIAGGLGYSNTESTVASVAGVAYSMIGESTPGTFYEALTESMMEDGFLSRFLVVAYDGDRPERNQTMLEVPDDALVNALVGLCDYAQQLINKGESSALGRTEEAAAIMAAFDAEAHREIVKTDDESRRQMWNRATLKALRVAGLLAVGDHYMMPSISADHMRWAIDLVRRDIAIMTKKLEGGDVGSGDKARERKLVGIIKKWITYTPTEIPKTYQKWLPLQKEGLVPRAYIQQQTVQVASFYNHKLGANKAMVDVIEMFVANGWLIEIKPTDVHSKYGQSFGRCYRVVDLPDYKAAGDK